MNILNSSEIRNGVLGGLDGHLFMHDGAQQQFAYLSGELRPSDESIANFFSNIDNRQWYCTERKIKFLHLVHPSKPVVLTDKVPAPWRERIQSLYRSSYVAARDGNVPSYIHYPDELLRSLQGDQQSFTMLDSHQSPHGALAVARYLLQQLDIDDYAPEELIKTVRRQAGDLARLVGSAATEQVHAVIPRANLLLLGNEKALPGTANHMVLVHNSQSLSKRRLLIVGDGFIGRMLRFLAPRFRDVLYVRGENFQPDLVELFAPDVVITSNAEQYLAHVKSDLDSSPALMGVYGDASYQPTVEFRKMLTAQLSYRHHRRVYDHWCWENRMVDLAPVGLCRIHEVEVLDAASRRFRSLGSDPWFAFNPLPLAPGQHYQLNVKMRSEVASAATLYFTDASGAGFAESHTVHLPVVAGDNDLRFVLDYGNLGKSLRFDPLQCSGEFSISDIALVKRAAASA